MGQAMRMMEARYAGRCGTCYGEIAQGERIGYDGKAHHAGCLDVLQALTDRATAALASLPKKATAAVALRRMSGDGPEAALVYVDEECEVVSRPEALPERYMERDLSSAIGTQGLTGSIGTRPRGLWVYVVVVGR